MTTDGTDPLDRLDAPDPEEVRHPLHNLHALTDAIDAMGGVDAYQRRLIEQPSLTEYFHAVGLLPLFVDGRSGVDVLMAPLTEQQLKDLAAVGISEAEFLAMHHTRPYDPNKIQEA